MKLRYYFLAIFFCCISCGDTSSDEGRINVITMGPSFTEERKAIVEGEVILSGELPQDFSVVGRGILYGLNSSGLEIESYTHYDSFDELHYNNTFECFQDYVYKPISITTSVQNIEISNIIEKDDGSVWGYEFISRGGMGIFKCLLTNLNYGTKYYAKAFAHITNYNGFDKFLYGEIIEFTTGGIAQDPTVFISVDALGIGVMKSDIGTTAGGLDAYRLCSNINFYDGIGGYHDWRIPTLDELKYIYNIRQQIGGFKDEPYWSSTVYGESPYYYFWNFGNNSAGHQGGDNSFVINANVRLVRTIK